MLSRTAFKSLKEELVKALDSPSVVPSEVNITHPLDFSSLKPAHFEMASRLNALKIASSSLPSALILILAVALFKCECSAGRLEPTLLTTPDPYGFSLELQGSTARTFPFGLEGPLHPAVPLPDGRTVLLT